MDFCIINFNINKDVSKQIWSACVIHLVNILAAMLLTLGNLKSDQCVWYFISIFFDATLGVLICYGLNYGVNTLSLKYDWKLLKSGLYYEEYMGSKGKMKMRMNTKMYFAQLGMWTIITIIVNT